MIGQNELYFGKNNWKWLGKVKKKAKLSWKVRETRKKSLLWEQSYVIHAILKKDPRIIYMMKWEPCYSSRLRTHETMNLELLSLGCFYCHTIFSSGNNENETQKILCAQRNHDTLLNILACFDFVDLYWSQPIDRFRSASVSIPCSYVEVIQREWKTSAKSSIWRANISAWRQQDDSVSICWEWDVDTQAKYGSKGMKCIPCPECTGRISISVTRSKEQNLCYQTWPEMWHEESLLGIATKQEVWWYHDHSFHSLLVPVRNWASMAAILGWYQTMLVSFAPQIVLRRLLERTDHSGILECGVSDYKSDFLVICLHQHCLWQMVMLDGLHRHRQLLLECWHLQLYPLLNSLQVERTRVALSCLLNRAQCSGKLVDLFQASSFVMFKIELNPLKHTRSHLIAGTPFLEKKKPHKTDQKRDNSAEGMKHQLLSLGWCISGFYGEGVISFHQLIAAGSTIKTCWKQPRHCAKVHVSLQGAVPSCLLTTALSLTGARCTILACFITFSYVSDPRIWSWC